MLNATTGKTMLNATTGKTKLAFDLLPKKHRRGQQANWIISSNTEFASSSHEAQIF
jgi:hypothetical protein